ncbi:hypothetical protein [Rubritalea sp.]|uniref:hypothetical protein n=1 Tax=Rubritalea sp. TaxID=2109375 RepID=UPI003EF3CEA2
MKLLLFVITLGLSMALYADNNQQSLNKQIAEMVDTLEDGSPQKIKEFIQTYAIPDEMEGDFPINQELITFFIEQKRDPLLKVLQSLRNKDADLIQKNNEYIYEINGDDFDIARDKLIFVYSPSKDTFLLKN